MKDVLKPVTAGDSGMAINFIDFQKAFDSVYRPAMWQIMKAYGIPEGIIDIVKCLYNNSRCAVRTEGELGEWFQIVTGVRQGCILSPLIFLLVIDWVMKKATRDTASGIEWLTDSKLKDLDFADDIALLDVLLNGIQDLTSQVEDTAKLVGLRVNAGKTKMMTLGTLPHGNITVSVVQLRL